MTIKLRVNSSQGADLFSNFFIMKKAGIEATIILDAEKDRIGAVWGFTTLDRAEKKRIAKEAPAR
jgi:hypothetical protein